MARWAKRNTEYFAVITRVGDTPVIHGSHYGSKVDPTPKDMSGCHGCVFTSEELAKDYMATLPSEYITGGSIGWEVARVINTTAVESYWDFA